MKIIFKLMLPKYNEKNPLKICVETSGFSFDIEQFSGIAFDMDACRAKNTPTVFN
jgi:hypothetical protein